MVDYEHALHEPGLWRVPGSRAPAELRAAYDAGVERYEIAPTELAENVTTLVLHYLTALPEPLFTFELLPQFRACDEPAALRALVRRLPEENRACLRLFYEHLHLVERASARNLMTPANLKLSIPSLLGSVSPRLITDFDAVFADEASSSDEATCEAGAPREPP